MSAPAKRPTERRPLLPTAESQVGKLQRKTADETPVATAGTTGDKGEIVYLSGATAFQMADEWYDFASATHFWLQWRFRVMRRVLGAGELVVPALEVGCGCAIARNQIEAYYGERVDACDVNEAALRRAAPGRGQLYFYDVHQRRPEWREHFATIFLLDTLEHIRQPVPFLQSVAYHLRPNGRLLITVPALQWLYGCYDRAVGHVKRYRLSGLTVELAAAGLSVERHAYWGLSLLPVALARKLLLRFVRPERAVAAGIQPSSRLADGFLRLLMRVECACCPRPPIGASLVVLARKKEWR